MQKDNNNNKQIPKLRAKCSNWSIINILSQIAWPSSISNAKWGYVTERLWCTFSRGLKMVHCIVEVLHSHRLTNLSQRILRSRKCNENPDFHVLRQGSNKENSLWTGTRDWTSGYICIYNPLLGIHTPVTTFLSYNLISHRWWSSSNRPFPSSPGPLYQNEVRCSAFLVERSFICMGVKNHFHIKGWAPNLVLIQRPGELKNSLFKQNTVY